MITGDRLRDVCTGKVRTASWRHLPQLPHSGDPTPIQGGSVPSIPLLLVRLAGVTLCSQISGLTPASGPSQHTSSPRPHLNARCWPGGEYTCSCPFQLQGPGGGQPHWPCGGSERPCLTRMHACTHAHEHTLTRLMGTPRRLGQPGWRLRPESLA